MKCRCKAGLSKCNVDNPLCPASTARLLYDEEEAVKELYDFDWLDKGGTEVRNE